MRDEELEALVRMAVEIDALEEAAADERGAREGARRRPRVLAVGAALAAGLAVAALGWLRPGTPPAAPAPIPVAIGGGEAPDRAAAPVAASVDPWVVLAIFSGWNGECRCLHVSTSEPGRGRPLESVGSAELLAMAFESPCSASVERLVVLGIAGPEEGLPATHAEAEALAACLGPGAETSTALASRAAMCLEPGMMVRAELLESDRLAMP